MKLSYEEACNPVDEQQVGGDKLLNLEMEEVELENIVHSGAAWSSLMKMQVVEQDADGTLEQDNHRVDDTFEQGEGGEEEEDHHRLEGTYILEAGSW
jgi:hypothetical protein